MVPVFRELDALRDDVFKLLRSPDPAQARDLYLLAGITCGLLAHASDDLGYIGAAHVQACAALVCADKADHPTLAAWVLGVRALQSEWSGRPGESLRFVAQARAQVVRERVPSTVSVWLAAIEARAHARRGDRDRALDALKVAADDRSRLTDSREDRNEFDAVGGILTFTKAKQHYYAGTTYRRVGEFDAAQANARAAISAYATGPAEQRSYGDEAIAWIDLSIARASGDHADLDGSAEALATVREQSPDRRLPMLLAPLEDLTTALSASRIRDARQAVEMRTSIRELVASCQRPAAEVEA
jgi:hypothetical protein